MKKLLIGVVLLLALTGCVAEDGSQGVQTTTQPAPSAEQRLEEMAVELGAEPGFTPNKVMVDPQLFPLPPGWTPPSIDVPEGYSVYSVEVRTVDVANLPTVRRFAATIQGIDNEGKMAIARPEDQNGNSFYVDGIDTSPHVYDLVIGPGVVTVTVQIALAGKIGEGVIITVSDANGPTGLMGGGRIEGVREGQVNGVVFVQFLFPVV